MSKSDAAFVLMTPTTRKKSKAARRLISLQFSGSAGAPRWFIATIWPSGRSDDLRSGEQGHLRFRNGESRSLQATGIQRRVIVGEGWGASPCADYSTLRRASRFLPRAANFFVQPGGRFLGADCLAFARRRKASARGVAGVERSAGTLIRRPPGRTT